MGNRLEYRSNNAFDSILLVDMETGLVRSRWDVTDKSLSDFLDESQDAADWDDQSLQFEMPTRTGEDYGELLGYRDPGGKVLIAPSMSAAADRLLNRDNAN